MCAFDLKGKLPLHMGFGTAPRTAQFTAGSHPVANRRNNAERLYETADIKPPRGMTT